MKRRALGKGLDALLPQPPASPYRLLDVAQVRPNQLQPRVRFDDEKLQELAASIREKGLLQPIVVRPVEDGYELIAGERRWRACQRAGLEQVPALVKDASDPESLQLALIENVQRDDLSPIEEAQAYRLMVEQFGMTQEAVATNVGRSRASVANTLRLLQLPKTIQALVISGELSMGHARAILPLPIGRLTALARDIVLRGLSVRQTERRVQSLLSEDKPVRNIRRKDPNFAAAERRLEERLQTRVEIRSKSGSGGTIVLHYHSPDELDRLFEALLP
jgi:ParB family transcriptional regulator, chromosome partitioning protein